MQVSIHYLMTFIMIFNAVAYAPVSIFLSNLFPSSPTRLMREKQIGNSSIRGLLFNSFTMAGPNRPRNLLSRHSVILDTSQTRDDAIEA